MQPRLLCQLKLKVELRLLHREGGDDTTTTVIIETVYEPACNSIEVCARWSPSAEPSATPVVRHSPSRQPRDDACTDTCVYSTFT
eukprot:scaffold7470_cov140-Skeletonema_menzelii.AAC.7